MEKRPGLGRKEDASCELDLVNVEDVEDVEDRGHITISLSQKNCLLQFRAPATVVCL